MAKFVYRLESLHSYLRWAPYLALNFLEQSKEENKGQLSDSWCLKSQAHVVQEKHNSFWLLNPRTFSH